MDKEYFKFIRSSIETNDIKIIMYLKNYLKEEKLKSTKYTNIPKDSSSILKLYNKKEEMNIVYIAHDIFVVEYDKNDDVFIHWCWGLPYLTKKEFVCSLELFLWARNQSNISISLKELLLKNTIYIGKNSCNIELKLMLIVSMTCALLKPTSPIVQENLKLEYKNYFPPDSNYTCFSIIYES